MDRKFILQRRRQRTPTQVINYDPSMHDNSKIETPGIRSYVNEADNINRKLSQLLKQNETNNQKTTNISKVGSSSSVERSQNETNLVNHRQFKFQDLMNKFKNLEEGTQTISLKRNDYSNEVKFTKLDHNPWLQHDKTPAIASPLNSRTSHDEESNKQNRSNIIESRQFDYKQLVSMFNK